MWDNSNESWSMIHAVLFMAALFCGVWYPVPCSLQQGGWITNLCVCVFKCGFVGFPCIPCHMEKRGFGWWLCAPHQAAGWPPCVCGDHWKLSWKLCVHLIICENIWGESRSLCLMSPFCFPRPFPSFPQHALEPPLPLSLKWFIPALQIRCTGKDYKPSAVWSEFTVIHTVIRHGDVGPQVCVCVLWCLALHVFKRDTPQSPNQAQVPCLL